MHSLNGARRLQEENVCSRGKLGSYGALNEVVVTRESELAVVAGDEVVVNGGSAIDEIVKQTVAQLHEICPTADAIALFKRVVDTTAALSDN